MTTGRTITALLAALLVAAPLAACGDDTGGGSGGGDASSRPTCEEIGEFCHDSETELGQDCHEFGEDEANDEEACAAREEECRGECI